MKTASKTHSGKKLYGKIVNLGFNPKKIHINIQEDTILPYCIACIKVIIKMRHADFFIENNSPYKKFLKNEIDSGKIHIIDNIKQISFKTDKFIFIGTNNNELNDISSIHNLIPPNYICPEDLILFYNNRDYFNKMVDIINNISIGNKKFYGYSENSEQYTIFKILYLICNNIQGIASFNILYAHYYSSDINVFNTYSLKEIDHEKFSILIYNNHGLQCIYYFLNNLRLNYFFLFGNKKSSSASCLNTPPFILWSYPHAGTGRFMPVFSAVTERLGFNMGRNAWTYYDWYYAYRHTFPYLDSAKISNDFFEDRIVDLYKVIPPISYITLHHPFYHINEIVNKTNSKVIILMRDFRDIIISNIKWFYLSAIYHDKSNFENIALDFMETGGTVYGNRTSSLFNITKELVSALNNSKIYFIKFEDINKDPLRTYMKFFENFGFSKNPAWVDSDMINLISISIKNNQPKPGRGKHGTWKEFFTPRMKEYFKKNSNNFLQEFGYEQNNDW